MHSNFWLVLYVHTYTYISLLVKLLSFTHLTVACTHWIFIVLLFFLQAQHFCAPHFHPFFTSALAPCTGESIFRFLRGPMAARAVRLASLCLIWASSSCCICGNERGDTVAHWREGGTLPQWPHTLPPPPPLHPAPNHRASNSSSKTHLFGLLFKPELLGVFLPRPRL